MSNIAEENKRFWKRCFAESNFKFKSLASKDFSHIIKLLRKYHVRKVLDLGCGYGYWSIALSRTGFQVKAVDISLEAIKRVREWANEEGLSLETEVCSVQELTVSSRNFDAIKRM